ncbi:MAG: polysaccharide deacetylase family protein [Alphaproteobacteria bacterium]
MLIACPFDEAEEACQRVLDWAGADRAGPAQDRTLGAEEIARLARSKLVDIGGHTVSHRSLDKVSRDVAIAEIEGCRTRLSEIAGREIHRIPRVSVLNVDGEDFGRFLREIVG